MGEIRFFHRSRLPNDREAHNNCGDCIIAGRDISRRYTTILRQVARTRADSALLQYPRCNKRTRLRPQHSRAAVTPFLRFSQSARAQINGSNKPVGLIVSRETIVRRYFSKWLPFPPLICLCYAATSPISSPFVRFTLVIPLSICISCTFPRYLHLVARSSEFRCTRYALSIAAHCAIILRTFSTVRIATRFFTCVQPIVTSHRHVSMSRDHRAIYLYERVT